MLWSIAEFYNLGYMYHYGNVKKNVLCRKNFEFVLFKMICFANIQIMSFKMKNCENSS